jgi:hypothetical protein
MGYETSYELIADQLIATFGYALIARDGVLRGTALDGE